MSHVPFAEVPIIHQGLRQEETIIQITLALDYLDKVSNGIFQHIKSSVEKQKNHLTRLQERSKVVHKKMDKLAGTNKATKVFASAKYPGCDIPRDHVLDFLSTPLPKLDRTNVRISSKYPPYDPESIKDKCQHFHIKTNTKKIKKNVEVTPEEGLGSLPADLDSVSALLLFNTSENLYKKYVMLDPLGVVTKTRQVLEDEIRGDLDAAPRSMCQEVVEFKMGENYFYSPTLQEVPELDMPLDLPDLPGIAGDLQFSMDSEPHIAPSSSTPIPELPAVFVETPSETVLPTPPLPPPAPLMGPPEEVMPPPAVMSPPPPPPPPLPVIPPPPPAPELAQDKHPPATKTPTVVAPVKSDDARASLMEAIRNAGGKDKAKLRSAIDRKQEAKRKQEEESMNKTTGGNLMADLHAKLSLRRKGISGSQVGSDPLEKFITMIPPPPIKEVQSDTDEPDADWEED